jgi:hypothetical protein
MLVHPGCPDCPHNPRGEVPGKDAAAGLAAVWLVIKYLDIF